MQPRQDLMAKVLQYKRWLIIGGAVVSLLFILSLFFQGGPSVQERAMNTSDRIQKLQEFMVSHRTDLTTTALVNQNANISTILSGASANVELLNKNIFEGKAKATDAAKKQNVARIGQLKSRMDLAKEANTFELRYRQSVADELQAIVVEADKLAKSSNQAVSSIFQPIVVNITTSLRDLRALEL